MPSSKSKPPLKKSMPPRRRRAISSPEELVRTRLPEGGAAMPLIIEPALDGVDLKSWIAGHRELIEDKLLEHGGILFRGFGIHSPEAFEELPLAASEDLLEYKYRSTPRSEVKGRVYSSTEYPPDQTIPFHNEMAYTRSWPRKIWFCCLLAAPIGGETPLADSAEVYRRLDPAIRERFEDQGVLYVRNYGAGLDLPWETVFQTSDPQEVERFCADKGIAAEWLDGGARLRTRQVAQATLEHPATGVPVWFNQAHLFHVSSLPEDVREPLLATSAEEDLPRNTYYGDGTPLEPEVLDRIRDAYEHAAVAFPWQNGDALLLDNILVAHGRRPFEGDRRVIVSMVDEMSAEASAPAAGGSP